MRFSRCNVSIKNGGCQWIKASRGSLANNSVKDRSPQSEVFNRIIKRYWQRVFYPTSLIFKNLLIYCFHYSFLEFSVNSWFILSARDVCSKDTEEKGNRCTRRQCLIRKFFSLKFSRIMGIIHPRGKARLNPYETRWQTGIKRPKYSGAAVTRAGMKFWDFFQEHACFFRITSLLALLQLHAIFRVCVT